jgi:hypothetical protein
LGVATIMIADFSGMNPLRDPVLLPDNNAQYADNCWLYRGQVRGFRHATNVYTTKYADTQQIYRIPKDISNVVDFTSAGSYWVEYPDPFMTTIRNPTVGDQWNRYYFFPSDEYASNGDNPAWPTTQPAPTYNTLDNIIAGTPGYPLGIPAPTGGAPGVVPASGNTETRAYVYTYVSAYAEEGAPSPATTATGAATGTWVVTIPAPVGADYNGRNITHYRLYRTVTDTQGNASYYQVVEVPFSTSPVVINDNYAAGSITANVILPSIGYAPPPAGLQGVVMMANGIAAGFTNEREVWFCMPYLPHAWPASFALTVDYPIVGLTANGASLNILTQGPPFIATGITPDTMTIGKVTANEPCISRGSIVTSGEGAYYASPNGVQLLNTGGTQNMTQNIYEKEFHNALEPQNWASGRYGSAYVAFVKGPPVGGDHGGFVIDYTQGNNMVFSYLHFANEIVNAMTDELSGQLFALLANGSVMQWNPPVGNPGTTSLWDWEWRSKQFRFPHPQEFKAFTALFDIPPEVQITLGVRNTDQEQVFDPTSQYLTLTVFADGRQVVIREIQTSGEVLLIPGGFKATLWEFLFAGQIGLKHFKAASSVKELKAM